MVQLHDSANANPVNFEASKNNYRQTVAYRHCISLISVRLVVNASGIGFSLLASDDPHHPKGNIEFLQNGS